jgi:hypothetical protein
MRRILKEIKKGLHSLLEYQGEMLMRGNLTN